MADLRADVEDRDWVRTPPRRPCWGSRRQTPSRRRTSSPLGPTFFGAVGRRRSARWCWSSTTPTMPTTACSPTSSTCWQWRTFRFFVAAPGPARPPGLAPVAGGQPAGHRGAPRSAVRSGHGSSARRAGRRPPGAGTRRPGGPCRRCASVRGRDGAVADRPGPGRAEGRTVRAGRLRRARRHGPRGSRQPAGADRGEVGHPARPVQENRGSGQCARSGVSHAPTSPSCARTSQTWTARCLHSCVSRFFGSSPTG